MISLPKSNLKILHIGEKYNLPLLNLLISLQHLIFCYSSNYNSNLIFDNVSETINKIYVAKPNIYKRYNYLHSIEYENKNYENTSYPNTS